MIKFSSKSSTEISEKLKNYLPNSHKETKHSMILWNNRYEY